MIPWHTILMSPGLSPLINCGKSRDIHTTYIMMPDYTVHSIACSCLTFKSLQALCDIQQYS